MLYYHDKEKLVEYVKNVKHSKKEMHMDKFAYTIDKYLGSKKINNRSYIKKKEVESEDEENDSEDKTLNRIKKLHYQYVEASEYICRKNMSIEISNRGKMDYVKYIYSH
jgi:hypothetical protein